MAFVVPQGNGKEEVLLQNDHPKSVSFQYNISYDPPPPYTRWVVERIWEVRMPIGAFVAYMKMFKSGKTLQ